MIFSVKEIIMVDIWKYQDAKRLIITDIDGVKFIGTLGDLFSVEDEADEYGFDEDNLTLWVNGQPISFKQSEITKVEVLE
ncbi:MAG: hypothetical protein GX802_06305 [Clostridiales bacterium]|nr:hypothetical protein [Clostridiales bacterium]